VTKLVFHLLEFVNLPYPLEKDPVVNIKSSLLYKDVRHFILDDDLALIHHVIFEEIRPLASAQGQGGSAT
jgi:hypothetical protein